jgi:hypothetical protein
MEIPLTITMTIADSDTSKYPYDKIKIVFKAE